MGLVIPNIETIRNNTIEANTIDEEKILKEYTDSIESAAGIGSYEVVFVKEMDSLYISLFTEGGYNVCVGKYNDTEKICTLIEWRENPKWEVKNDRIVEKSEEA